MFPWLKRLLPRTLYVRALMIIVTPMVAVQFVAGWVFFDRHWDTVSRKLAAGVAGELAVVVDMLQQNMSPGPRDALMLAMRNVLQLDLTLLPGATLPPEPPQRDADFWRIYLVRGLAERIGQPFVVDARSSARTITVHIQMPDGVLQAALPRDRLYFSTAFLWLFWMVLSSLILVGVAAIFMRNQVRPIRRLAAAAEAFGKGQPIEDFKIVGAVEVRQAATAFKLMRDRITRQIQQRTEMLAGVSHDLRTPLTRMKLGLALLPESEDSAALRDDVDEMQRMLDAYLAFARGEGTEESVPTEIDTLVGEVVAGARRAGGRVDLNGAANVRVPLRPAAFKRCLDNLVGNAVRYATHVWVNVRRSASAIEIVIDDDGPGIPVDQREEVFRPFLRLEGSRNSGTGGIGLGLSIAREIVQSHGGTIRLAESPQGGLRVAVRLPL